MRTERKKFAILSNGKKVHLFTVSNGDITFSVTDFGATLTSLIVPSKTGKKDDIVLGFPTFEEYIKSWFSFFGVTVGRYANRISNASFSIGEKKYTLDANDGKNTLHSGYFGYNRRMWKGEFVETPEGAGVLFKLKSPDGDQGFPGNLSIHVTYFLTKENSLSITYKAKTDAATPISLTNHSFFNLKGAGFGDVLEHQLQIISDSYVEPNDKLIPTGKLLPVKNTPFDFNEPKPIGKDIAKVKGGYDHCYCLSNAVGENFHECAKVFEPTTGRTMIVSTDQPGVQLYTANGLGPMIGKDGNYYSNHGAFCLETQNFPDCPNVPSFPNCIITPENKYKTTTTFDFSW